MPSERILSLFQRSNRTNAENNQQAYLELNAWFQRGEVWKDDMKVRLIETILLGYALNPIWVIIKKDKDEELVLDGKQRLTTICDFMNNKFVLTDIISKELQDEKLVGNLVGKVYKDFPGNIKSKIRDYEISVNKYGPELLEDHDKLMDIYMRLNHSSVQLNKFELMKPIYDVFYTSLNEYKDDFFKSPIYLTAKSERGNIESFMIQLLALTEPELPSFSSLTNLSDRWIVANLGLTVSTVEKALSEKTKHWKNMLDFVKHIMNTFYKQEIIVTKKETKLINVVLITRCAAIIRDKSLFNRHSQNLCVVFKKMLEKDIQELVGCKDKNAKYQQRLIKLIDETVQTELGERKPRCFTQQMKLQKLEQQNGKCAICNESIDTNKDTYEGDHIKPWSLGGQTIMDNLQVLHTRCHQIKTINGM
jgi:5-methylcytosine-specific restriction endonuclease McrA